LRPVSTALTANADGTSPRPSFLARDDPFAFVERIGVVALDLADHRLERLGDGLACGLDVGAELASVVRGRTASVESRQEPCWISYSQLERAATAFIRSVGSTARVAPAKLLAGLLLVQRLLGGQTPFERLAGVAGRGLLEALYLAEAHASARRSRSATCS
jgi:hypothetical protein